MKIKTSSKKLIILITAVVILTAAIGLAYYFNRNDSDQVGTSGDQVAQKAKSDEDQAKALQEKPENKNISPNTDSPVPTTTDETTNKTVVQMSIAAEVYNGTLSIRGGIDNAVLYDGNCYALLAGPNGEIIKKNTVLLQNPSTTDCKTIVVNTNELSKGRWSVTLNYESDNIEGKTDEKTFDNN